MNYKKTDGCCEEEAKQIVYSHLAQAMDDIKRDCVQPMESVISDILKELEVSDN